MRAHGSTGNAPRSLSRGFGGEERIAYSNTWGSAPTLGFSLFPGGLLSNLERPPGVQKSAECGRIQELSTVSRSGVRGKSVDVPPGLSMLVNGGVPDIVRSKTRRTRAVV